MINVMLNPCQVHVREDYIYIVLKNCSFTLEFNHKVYEFVPTRDNVVIVNRKTGKIENSEAVLAFRKDGSIFYFTMAELTLMPEFLIEIHFIAEPYYEKDLQADTEEEDTVITELEQQNVKRLIDQALDEKDEQKFFHLLKYLD